jgi:hypothetical protein
MSKPHNTDCMYLIEDIRDACFEWDKTDKFEFSFIVDDALNIFSQIWEQLALKFEVDFSTICGWATGAARPHPDIQQEIISFIKTYTSKYIRVFMEMETKLQGTL